jgi:hypothetical protein
MTNEPDMIPIVRKSAVTGNEHLVGQASDDESAARLLKRLRGFYPQTDELYADYGRTVEDVKAGRP